MKKILYAILIIMMSLSVGCGSSLALPDHPIVFETKTNGEYLYIVWGSREYVPYCAFDPSQVVDCIGYYEDGAARVFVF